MLDFTSSSYLGLHHPSRALRPWHRLTTGKPAVLGIPARQVSVEASLARLIGCEQSLLLPSTLHIFWNLFDTLNRKREIAIYLDDGAYQIPQWGIERASIFGIPVHRFAHYQPQSLRQLIRTTISSDKRPAIVADGFCIGCGRPAPVARYLKIAREYDGYVILDDTQALGILGRQPTRENPLGMGGGGSLRWQGTSSPRIIIGSSLAKGFSVPVAVMGSSRTFMQRFKTVSETQSHCSPPSIADIHAVEHALLVNGKQGEALRHHLMKLIARFRLGLAGMGLSTSRPWFPCQSLQPVPGLNLLRLHNRLNRLGISAILHGTDQKRKPQLSFLLTARHSLFDIEAAIKAIDAAKLPPQARSLSR